MNIFELNLAAPGSPIPFTMPDSEKQYWLNPNGTVTEGGPWVGVLLPINRGRVIEPHTP